METGMIAIAAVLGAAIIIPTLLLIQNSKEQSKKLFKGLKSAVTENNGVLTYHIEESNFALGIDKTNKTIYFFKKTEDVEISKVIDLTKLPICDVHRITKRVRKDKGFEELIKRIDLVFASKNGNEEQKIELYNEEDNLFTDELNIAKDWKKIVDTLLSEQPTVLPQRFPVAMAS
jgi:hypothetical protein